MNFVKFVENRYQELAFESEIEKKGEEFSVLVDSEKKALHWALTFYRESVKWIMIPKVLFHFFAVKLGFESEPEPKMINKLKKDKEDALKAKKEAEEAANVSSIPVDIK